MATIGGIGAGVGGVTLGSVLGEWYVGATALVAATFLFWGGYLLAMRSRGGPDFRHWLAATTGMTFWLILLGIYTAAGGYGLTCEARWPLCDGAVFGLFPAHWPSFVEWFHRLIAMVGGLLILGVTLAAWRGGRSRGIRLSLLAATLVLPSQIVLGALTVTAYEVAILTAHFATAMAIFALLVAATAWSFDVGTTPRYRLAAGATGVGALVAGLALTPDLLVAPALGPQIAYYGLGLAAFCALLALALWTPVRRVRLLAGAATATLVVQLLLGRLWLTGDTGLVLAGLGVLLLGLAGLALRLDREAAAAIASGPAVSAD